MRTATNKASLSAPRQRLLELFQRLNFGRVEGLVVRGGEPILAPPPRVVRDVKFGGENGPRAELAAGDFLLKTQAAELLACLDELKDGTIDLIEVKNGLPFRMLLAGLTA